MLYLIFFVNNNGNNYDGRKPYNWDVNINSLDDFYKLNTALDNENIILTVAGSDAKEKLPTILKFDNVNGNKGEIILLKTNLTDTNNNPLIKKLINFTVDGKELGSNATNNDGVAVYHYNITQHGGNYNISSTFNGDDEYLGLTANNTLTVPPTSTKIITYNATGNKNSIVTLTAHLTDNIDGSNITGKVVKFFVNNIYKGNATTDSNGFATYNYNITEDIGNYSINTTFNEDNEYLGSTDNNILTVKPELKTTKLTIDSVNGNKWDIITLTANLTNSNNDIPNKTVLFTIDGEIIGNNTTNSDGVAVYHYNITQHGGKYNISSTFNEDNEYLDSTANNTLTVSPTNTNIITYNAIGNKNSIVSLTAHLTDGVDGSNITGKVVKFFVNNIYKGNATTDSNGFAVYHYNITEDIGNYSINTTFNEDNEYLGSTDNNILTVKLEPTPPEPTIVPGESQIENNYNSANFENGYVYNGDILDNEDKNNSNNSFNNENNDLGSFSNNIVLIIIILAIIFTIIYIYYKKIK